MASVCAGYKRTAPRVLLWEAFVEMPQVLLQPLLEPCTAVIALTWPEGWGRLALFCSCLWCSPEQLSLDAQAAWEAFPEYRINKMQNVGVRELSWASCANTAQELACLRSLTEIRGLVQIRGRLGALDHIPAQTCGRSK